MWAVVGSGAFGRPVGPELLQAAVERGNNQLRTEGWDPMIAGFDQQEREVVPDWMKRRIRATDITQLIGWNEGRLGTDWWAWDSLPRVAVPTLFVTGELEDPADVVAEGAARMPLGSRFRVTGEGHINAFIKSNLVLPTRLGFLAEYART